MMVRMLVSTGIQSGAFVHVGDVLDVDAKTQKRWAAHGIAEVVAPENLTSATAEISNNDNAEVQSSSTDELPPSTVSERKKNGKPHKEK